MTTTYTARLFHHSISSIPIGIRTLKATTEHAAKVEARKLLGDGRPGNRIYLEELVDGVRLPVAAAVIGQPGWEKL